MKRLVMSAIKLYQRTLSPDHGPLKSYFKHGVCKYHPSCSEYTHQAVDKYGTIGGLVRGVWRILRCNPFSKGGLDEVK